MNAMPCMTKPGLCTRKTQNKPVTSVCALFFPPKIDEVTPQNTSNGARSTARPSGSTASDGLNTRRPSHHGGSLSTKRPRRATRPPFFPSRLRGRRSPGESRALESVTPPRPDHPHQGPTAVQGAVDSSKASDIHGYDFRTSCFQVVT